MTDAEYGDRQAQAIERCVTALLAATIDDPDEVLAAIKTMHEKDGALALATLFDMLNQVFGMLPADVKEYHLRQWEEDSLELRLTE